LYSALTWRSRSGKGRGSEEGGEGEEVGGPVKPIAVVGGLRVGLQVSGKHVRHMCIRTYMKESLLGSLRGLAEVFVV